ncbi:hypothetical protein ACFL0W_05470 [Nanoarchaeota archaeon]
MANNKTVLGVTLKSIMGIIFFLILLGIANIVSRFVLNYVFVQVVAFFNYNLGLIILFSIIFYLGELFNVFNLPFNIPAPIFNAVGSIFLIEFIFRVFAIVSEFVGITNLFILISVFKIILMLLVFVIVIIVGYIGVFIPKPCKKEQPKPTKKSKSKKKPKSKKSKLEWEDIGEDFKGLINDIIKKIRKALK